tara:strand:+ start:11 stop:916 length:906 start_codon:yes stop_codon:yes gene_type:complete
MQSIVNAIVGNLSSSRFKNLPESEKEKIIKAMSTEKVSSTVGDEIFDYYFTNNKDSVSNCMKKHIYNEGEDCYEPRMNSMFEIVPNFIIDPNKQFLKNITFDDYIKNADEYDKAFKNFIPSKIKEYFFKNGKLNLYITITTDGIMVVPGTLPRFTEKIKLIDQDKEKKKQELQKCRNGWKNLGLQNLLSQEKHPEAKLESSRLGGVLIFALTTYGCRLGTYNLEEIYNEISDYIKPVGIEDFTTYKIFLYYIATILYKLSLENAINISKRVFKQDKTDEQHKADTKKAREEAIELFKLVVE